MCSCCRRRRASLVFPRADPPASSPQVIENVKELCDKHGPFDAGYVLFGTSAYSPFHPDMLGPLMAPGTCGIWAQGGAGYDDVDVDFLTQSKSVRPAGSDA